MNTPQLSVVVPIHNGARWLDETLASIFSQSFRDYELILVDDASTDDLRSVLASHDDPRLNVVHLERNVGVAGARNEGIARARGAYIAFCDADDLCHPDRFFQQLEHLKKNPQLGVCGTAFTCFDTQDRETVVNPASNDAIRQSLMKGNCFGMSTMMGRAEIFKRNPFNQAMAPTEDYDIWTRLAGLGVPMSNLPDSLLRYRVHAQQASQQKAQKLDRLARKIRSLYCARLIGSSALIHAIEGEVGIDAGVLELAANQVAAFCESRPEFSPAEFRFMLAWLYQKLPDHGMRQWLGWCRLQHRLGIRLDRTYRINTALLAVLPTIFTRRNFDTLIKLKR